MSKPKKQKPKKNICQKPHTIDWFNWWYEEKNGITLIHEVRDKNDVYIQTDTIRITGRKLKCNHRRKR